MCVLEKRKGLKHTIKASPYTLGKEEQIKPKASSTKEIMTIKAETIKLKTKNNRENKTRSWFFGKTGQRKNKGWEREKAKITNIRNKRRHITTDPTDYIKVWSGNTTKSRVHTRREPAQTVPIPWKPPSAQTPRMNSRSRNSLLCERNWIDS